MQVLGIIATQAALRSTFPDAVKCCGCPNKVRWSTTGAARGELGAAWLQHPPVPQSTCQLQHHCRQARHPTPLPPPPPCQYLLQGYCTADWAGCAGVDGAGATWPPYTSAVP